MMLENDLDFCEYHSPNSGLNNDSSKAKKHKISSNKSNNPLLWPRKIIYDNEWSKIKEIIDNKIEILTRKFLEHFIKHELRFNDEMMDNFHKIPTFLLSLCTPLICHKIVNDIGSMLNPKKTKNTIIIELDPIIDTMRNVLNKIIQTFKDERIIDDYSLINEKLATIEDVIDAAIDDGKLKNLLIVIYEFEKFNMNILSKFIKILKSYTMNNTVSVRLIFFKQNLFNANLNTYLPIDIIDYLYVQIIDDEFQSKSSIRSIFIDIIQSKNLRIKFHPLLIEKLFQDFNRIEYTIEKFRNQLQLIVFDYFNQNPLSSICDVGQKRNIDDHDEDLALCFRNTLNISSLQQIPFDDEYMDNLLKLYDDLLTKNQQLIQCLNIVNQFFYDLAIISSYDHQFIRDYIGIFKHNIAQESANFSHLEYLHDVTQNRMLNALEKLIQNRTKFNIESHQQLDKFFNDYHRKLQELIQNEKLQQQKQNESIQKLGLQCQIKMVNDKLRNINSRYEWKRSLQPIVNNKKQENLSKYEKWKNDFVINLKKILMDHYFTNDQHVLIDKLFCNQNLNNHQNNLLSNRLNIDRILSMKNSTKIATKSSTKCPSLPIIYQLYKESNNNLNLNEMYEKFCQERKTSLNGETNDQNENDFVCFVNTIFDFEYIGILKSNIHNRYTKVVHL